MRWQQCSRPRSGRCVGWGEGGSCAQGRTVAGGWREKGKVGGECSNGVEGVAVLRCDSDAVAAVLKAAQWQVGGG